MTTPNGRPRIVRRVPSTRHTAAIRREFQAFVEAASFPCLAAKGAAHRGTIALGVFDALGSSTSTAALAPALDAFVRALPADGTGLRTYVAVFPRRVPRGELTFERLLWRQLQLLHDHERRDAAWDPTVSADPESAKFSFSFAGRALFVIGLHPASSRLARRFRWPALVFNPRAQFDRLRAEGRYERLRDTVRARDITLQGTPNPILADFGERSEARQYSGRAVEPAWRCPFHAR